MTSFEEQAAWKAEYDRRWAEVLAHFAELHAAHPRSMPLYPGADEEEYDAWCAQETDVRPW
jgi:hypothetical protein